MEMSKIAQISVRGTANVAAIMPKINAAVTERSQGTRIDLSTAENWLIREDLVEICQKAITDNLTSEDLSYPRSFAGFPQVLSAFADFFNAYFSPMIPVEVKHLATAPGAASCIDTLLYNICDPGDGVLVPGPFWSGFDFQFQARSSVIPVPVVTHNLRSSLSLSLIPALERAFDDSNVPIKGLLMTNPNNPLGQCYSRQCLEECIKFCQRRNIHYISDEVYALTKFECPELPSPTPFVSALSIDVAKLNCDISRVHTVWSTSKDFGQSGVRMGCTVTQGNPDMAVGLALASNTQTSTLSSIFVSSLLTSPNLSNLLELNSRKLSAAYKSLTSVFKKHNVEYIPSYAGLYVFAKIAPSTATWDEEAQVVQTFKEHGLLVSAGKGYHGPENEKGWARIGFAIPEEQLDRAIHIADDVFATMTRREAEHVTINHLQDVASGDHAGRAIVHLIDSLRLHLDVLKGGANREVVSALHDQSKLPDKRLASLANEAVNLLHETEQLLEPGPLVLADHFLGYVNSKCLVAAVELNIPDILESGSMTVGEIAQGGKAQPKRLRQVLRALHNNGIFSYDSSTDSYSNNSTSSMLLSNHWTQWRNWVDLYGNEFYDIARGIPQSCREGVNRMAAQVNYDTDLDMFTYFSEQGWLPRLHKTLSGGATAQAPGILQDYPWEDIADGRLLDIGGGGGGLLALLLREHKSLHGGILDLPKAINQATLNFHTPDGEYTDVGDRVAEADLVAGDFFIDIPRNEFYVMKWCLHDWDDEHALQILGNIRKAIIQGPKSRLIILESLLTEGRAGRLSRYADLIMMISAKGEERNEAQWRKLADESGWELNKIYPLRNAWPCAIELLPVWRTNEAVADGSISTTTVTTPPDSETALSIASLSSSQTDMEKDTGVSQLPSSPSAECPRVTTTMSFLEPWDKSKGQPYYRSVPDEGFESTNFEWVEHQVEVTDAQSVKESFTLDKNGFCYLNDSESLHPELVDALRANQIEIIKRLYYPVVEKMVRELTKASRVIIFDHTVRKRDPGIKKGDNPDGKEQPATVVHCDQSGRGALRRLKQNLEENEDVDLILKGRIRLLNVWRPLRGPVVDWPLGMMDFQTLDPSDIHPCDLWRHTFEERGQTVTYTRGEGQRWYYLDKQTTNEISVLKIWDSMSGGSVANMCPHAAFPHPDTPEGAQPRESVEVRCIVLDNAETLNEGDSAGSVDEK